MIISVDEDILTPQGKIGRALTQAEFNDHVIERVNALIDGHNASSRWIDSVGATLAAGAGIDEGAIADNQGAITSLQERVTAAETALTTARSAIAALQASTTALAATDATHASSLASLTADMAGMDTPAAWSLLAVQTLTGSGSYVPTTGTRRVGVHLVAGSGGGAGALGTALLVNFGEDGATGSAFDAWIDPGALVTGGPYAVGAGGAGGSSLPTGGAPGGDTTLTIQGTVYTAKGGRGGSVLPLGTAVGVVTSSAGPSGDGVGGGGGISGSAVGQAGGEGSAGKILVYEYA